MEISVRWIDVTPNLLNGQQPVDIFERPLLHGTKANGGLFTSAQVARCGVFWVPQTSILEPDSKWTFVREGDFVRVPVMAYRTTQRAAAAILQTGLEVGLRAAVELVKHTKDPVQGAVLVLGHECTDLSPHDAFRCYVGVALRT